MKRPVAQYEIAREANVSPTSSGLGSGLRELIALGLIERTPEGRFQLSEGLRT